MGRRSRKRSLSEGSPGVRERGTGEEREPGELSSRAARDAERRRLRAKGGRSGTPDTGRARPGQRLRRERPQAAWGSFPLSEMIVLLALILCIAGLIIWGRQGMIMLIVGLVLGSLAGLELAVREHFAGFRSHTTLLSAGVGLAAGAVTALLITGPEARVPVAAVALVVFGTAFYFLREAFKRRSGGLTFR